MWNRAAQCVLASALLLLACGCGGKDAANLDLGAATGPDTAGALFPGLPALPNGDADSAGLRSVSEEDNVQLGNEDWQHGTPGADYSDTNMVLYGPAGEFGAWAIWQWSGFTGGLVPNSVTIDATLDPGRSYWLLLSNYSLGNWEIAGQLSTSTFTHNFAPGYNYTSPGRSVYVALVADTSNAALIEQLNLRTDRDIDPPAPPTNLRAQNITSHQADILWDLNTDQDVLGYRLYSGPDADYLPGDPGVELLEGDLTYLDSSTVSANLESDTTYFYKLTAFDTAFNESQPSAVCEFTTLLNDIPVPDFSWTPSFVQVDREVLFDPSATTDEGDIVETLRFEWDFENDGVVDAQTTGPQIMPHTYSQRKTYHCRLIVSDTEASAEIVKDVQVSFRYDYFELGRAGGLPGLLAGIDSDPPTSRLAIGISTADGNEVRYFHNGAWETVPLADVPGDYLIDVVIGPQRIAALTASLVPVNGNDTAIDWYVMEYTGFTWVMAGSGKSSDNVITSGALACSPSGRYSLGLVTAYIPPGVVIEPDFSLHYAHEKQGGGYFEGSVLFGQGVIFPFDLVRTDSSSFIVHTKNGIDMVEALDNSSSSVHLQDCAAVRSIALEQAVDDLTQISWVVAQNNGAIVWGDNFGAPNDPGQVFTPADPPNFMLGLRPEGDNEAQFYWGASDSLGIHELGGYNSAANAGAGEEYQLGSGYGLADFGFGAFFETASNSGVYLAIQEGRDGELNGRFVNNGSIISQETLYQPGGLSPMLGYSWPVVFPDGSLSVFFQQPFPTALRGNAAQLDAPPVIDACGQDNFVIPNTACATGNGHEFITGAISDDFHLILTRFDDAATTGEENLVIPDSKYAMLQRNPSSGVVMLAYSQDSGKSIHTREWNGSGWEAPVQVHSSANYIQQFTFRPRTDSGWGIAFAYGNSELRLALSDGSSWSAPELIGNQVIAAYGGIGLGFSPGGDIALLVERDIAGDGVWLGERDFGEAAFSWQKLEDTDGSDARSCNVFYENNEPVAFYYFNPFPLPGPGVRVYEKIDGSYVRAQFDFNFFDVPLGTAVDDLGNIVMSGVYGNPAHAAYAVIYR